MNTRRLVRAPRSLAVAAVAVLTVLGGCNMDIENPNDPDAKRALVDPAGLEQLISGAFRTWVETRGDYFGALPMTAMADNYTASWNNAAIRYYSSVGSDCTSRCGWNAAGRSLMSVDSRWLGTTPPVWPNQNAESCVRTLPLSGMPDPRT